MNMFTLTQCFTFPFANSFLIVSFIEWPGIWKDFFFNPVAKTS